MPEIKIFLFTKGQLKVGLVCQMPVLLKIFKDCVIPQFKKKNSASKLKNGKSATFCSKTENAFFLHLIRDCTKTEHSPVKSYNVLRPKVLCNHDSFFVKIDP